MRKSENSGRPWARALKAVGIALALGVLAPLGIIAAGPAAQPAAATVYDATSVALKFKQASRTAVSPGGATGKNLGDIMKYAGVATINGVVIDAVVRTVALTQATIGKFDEGSAIPVGSPPTGSSQTVDDLLLTDIANTTGATEPSVTFEFSFYEGGTYTGVDSGVPVTLTNVAVNAYDIDSASSKKQFTDFRGFQSYKTYTASSTEGLDVSDAGSGFVRFASKSSTVNATATSGSYSFTRVQVNYDQISTLTVRMGALGAAGAYFALDFSAGGTWTTDGTHAVIPTTTTNPYNQPPTTADITTFYAAQGTGYVFSSSDFPYADEENNTFASIKLTSPPVSGAGSLEYNTGTAWVPVTTNQVITVSDLDLGKLRLIPTSTGGELSFEVNDGLAFSDAATLTFTAPPNSQTISFPTPASQPGASTQSFASGVTASSGLTPVLTSLSAGVCTVSGLTITTLALASGVTSATCVIVATQEGDADYGRAQAVTQQFSVSTLTGQAITFTDPGDQPFSSTPIVTDAATSATGLTVTLTSQTLGVCTISGTSIVPVTLGLCSVRATQAGNATYSAASPVTRSFTFTKSPQVITFAQPATRSLATSTFTVAPTTDATALAPTLASSTTSVCTVSSFTVTIVATGLCTLTASQAGDSTYLAASDVVRSFTVFDITTASYPTGDVGTAYSATQTLDGANGGGIWSTSDTLPDGIILDSSTGELSGTPTAAYAQTVLVTYTEDGASRDRSLMLQILAPTPLTPQTITFAQPDPAFIDDGPLIVAPTMSPVGLTPSLISTTTAVCTVSSFTVTFVAAGTCTLTASQAGDSTYAAASDVTRSFVISKRTQTIDFTQPGTHIRGSFTVAPTTNATGLTPALASGTTSVCTVSGFTVTLSAPGLCTLTASQAGNATYLAATDVVRSFAVILVTTSALPAGEVGSAYGTTLAAAGGIGGGSWSTTSPLPAGVTLNSASGTLSGTPSATFDSLLDISYTEGGATDTKSLRLRVAAAPVPPAVTRSTPERPTVPTPTPTPTPAPSAPPKPHTTVPSSAPVSSRTDTVDFGGNSTIAAADFSSSSDQRGQAIRSLSAMQSESIGGYAPGTAVQVDVIGAKTVAALAIAADGSIDATAVAKAIREATGGGQPGDFARLTEARPVSANELGNLPNKRIPDSDREYFSLSDLDTPVLLANLQTTNATNWLHFAVSVGGYKPGTTVYLAMTTQPVVFATAVVDSDGNAQLAGDMALDVLPSGVHHLRVIGDREIGGVTVDAAGKIQLTSAQMTEIQKFDQGTHAAVRITGDNTLGGQQLALRIIPLDQPVPWWLLWLLIGLGVLLSISRLARLGEGRVVPWLKRGVFLLAGLVPVVVGFFVDSLALSLASGATILLGLLLATVLPRLRRRHDDDPWDRALLDLSTDDHGRRSAEAWSS